MNKHDETATQRRLVAELAKAFGWVVLEPLEYAELRAAQARAAGFWHQMRRATGLPTDPTPEEMERWRLAERQGQSLSPPDPSAPADRPTESPPSSGDTKKPG
jgi:hypothetical protein